MGAWAGAVSCSERVRSCWSTTEAVQAPSSTLSDSGKRALVPVSLLGAGPGEGESRDHEPGVGGEGGSRVSRGWARARGPWAWIQDR